MKVALYCRVSTGEQTVENQKRDLLRYCQTRKWDIVKIFEDTGISGAISARPALDDLMRQARKHRFETVLVWKFDRFARSTQHLLSALQEFQSLGIDFVSFGEGVDTSTPMGRMIFTFLGGISEFELSILKDRVRSGIARAKSEGVRCGRPPLSIDTADIVRLRQEGKSLRQIAKAMGIGCGTVHRALSAVPKTSQK